MKLNADKAKAYALPSSPPICSKKGACTCKNYLSQTSAGSLVNYEVRCKERGAVNGRVADACFKKRLSSTELIMPSTG